MATTKESVNSLMHITWDDTFVCLLLSVDSFVAEDPPQGVAMDAIESPFNVYKIDV